MNRIFILSALFAVMCGFNSCNTSSEDFAETRMTENIQPEGFEKVEAFKNISYPVIVKLSDMSENFSATDTRAINESNDSINVLVSELTQYSADVLYKIGIDVEAEFGNTNDPRIALAGLALIEYQESINAATRANVGGCVLQAVGVNDLYKKGVKAAGKQIVKACVKKAVPYIGWGLTIADFANCMMN